MIVGSDCTGINGAAVALEMLRVPFEEVFASEADPNTRKILLHNFPKLDGRIHEDAQTRPVNPTRRVDVYTAGFPCQSWSKAGKNQGLDDPRGMVSLSIMNYLAEGKPRAFILENVPGLVDPRHRKDFDMMINFLRAIKTKRGQRMYRVSWKLVNAMDCGVPQSRNRLFIVGISGREKKLQAFRWPGVKETDPVRWYLDNDVADPPQLPKTKSQQDAFLNAISRIVKAGGDPSSSEADYICAIGGTGAICMQNVCPCITRNHCGSNAYFSCFRNRKLRTSEFFKLQGFPEARISAPQGVSDRQLRMMIGNAFNVTVIAQILDRVLWALDLTETPNFEQ